MLSIQQFRTNIENFIPLQTMLICAFREKFPFLKDWDGLVDFPKHGEIETSKGIWQFNLHGCGLSFIGSEGVIVDSHDMVSDFEIVDAWRLLQFLESNGAVREDELTMSDIEKSFEQLVQDGFLKASEKKMRKYKL